MTGEMFAPIFRRKIEELNNRLIDKKIKITPNATALKWLAEKNFNAQYGARSINRNVAAGLRERAIRIRDVEQRAVVVRRDVDVARPTAGSARAT